MGAKKQAYHPRRKAVITTRFRDMPISVLVSLCALGATLVVLLVSVGVTWGTLTTRLAHEKETREKDIIALDKKIAECRSDWKESIAHGGDGEAQRLSAVDSDVRGLGDKIDRGFQEVKAGQAALSSKLLEHDYEIKGLKERLQSVRAMPAAKVDPRRE